MTPIDSTNDQNTLSVELFKAAFTHNDQNTHQKRKLETALSSLLYFIHLGSLESRDLNMLEREYIVW